jgi:hypothetical protein
MQMIPASQQKTEPGEDPPMEGAVAENECHGTATSRSVKHDDVLAKHSTKGNWPYVHADNGTSILENKNCAKAAHAGE